MLFTLLLVPLLALVLLGGLPGFLLAVLWIGGGVYMVVNSRSRGLYADATFLLSWPIHLALDR